MWRGRLGVWHARTQCQRSQSGFTCILETKKGQSCSWPNLSCSLRIEAWLRPETPNNVLWCQSKSEAYTFEKGKNRSSDFEFHWLISSRQNKYQKCHEFSSFFVLSWSKNLSSNEFSLPICIASVRISCSHKNGKSQALWGQGTKRKLTWGVLTQSFWKRNQTLPLLQR